MDIKRINELMDGSRWTDLLGELTVGKHTLQFPSIGAIKSCKARAYDINSDHAGRRYTFNVSKDDLTVDINVEEELT